MKRLATTADGRTERVTIRLTRDERAKLRASAEALGKAESEFARDAIVKRQNRYARRPMSEAAAEKYEHAMRMRIAADEIRDLLEEIEFFTDPESIALCLQGIEQSLNEALADMGRVGDYIDLPESGDVLPPLGELH